MLCSLSNSTREVRFTCAYHLLYFVAQYPEAAAIFAAIDNECLERGFTKAYFPRFMILFHWCFNEAKQQRKVFYVDQHRGYLLYWLRT
ncbi:hypothetical protein [Legionella sp. MW5194]|uniref:hypothetical protein n=1 Tax=Legionella sp. MW5194 TaxID=2662448 RepID=UPI00351C7FA2